MTFKAIIPKWGLSIALLLIGTVTFADPAIPESVVRKHVQAHNQSALRIIESIFAKADGDIDLAQAKLAIDKLIDPSIDIESTLSRIDKMVKTLETGLAPDMMPLDKILSLSAFLYEGGYWNNFQPFQYNFTDPFGQSLDSKLLTSYLNTKKGNCISMPILYAILADRIGLDVTLATAPLHVFVKFNDPVSGNYFSIEATDRGSIASDDFYRKKSTITDTAINNGVYLKPLDKKAALAVMAILLSEHYANQGQWQQSIDIAKLTLEHYPNYAYAMIKIGNGNNKLLSEKLAEVQANQAYTPEEKQLMDGFHEQNKQWFAKAEKLGWQPVSMQENAAYLQSIKQRSTSLNQ